MVLSCAAAGAASAASARAKALAIIDQDPVGHPADRHRGDDAQAVGVDDRDVVRQAVGDVERTLVGAEREAPGARADQDVVDDLAARRRRPPPRGWPGRAPRRRGLPSAVISTSTGVTCSWRKPAGRNGMLPTTSRVATSMMLTTPESSAETQSSRASGVSAKRRGRVSTRMSAITSCAVDVDHVHEVRGLGGDEDEPAVRGDLHALRLLAGLEEADLLAGLDVPDRRRRVLLVRDVEMAAVGVQVEGLGLGDVGDPAQQLAGRHVVLGDHRVVGAADEERGCGRR